MSDQLTNSEAPSGIFIGIGVGPGDPELLTLKAARLIESADIVAYPSTTRKESTARAIAQKHILPGQGEFPVRLPMSNDRTETEIIYDQAALSIDQFLRQGQNVVFLCLGDPMLYGSFIYLYQRLKQQHKIDIVPGINAFSAASAVSQVPLTILEQSMILLAGYSSDELLNTALAQHDSIIILKAGQHRQRITALIKKSGRLDDAIYIEHASKPEQKIYRNINALPDGPGTYFSLFLVTKR